MSEGIWVSFETFFSFGINFSTKRHTRQFHTQVLHIKTEWSQFIIVTVIRGAIENKTKFFSAGQCPRPYAEAQSFLNNPIDGVI